MFCPMCLNAPCLNHRGKIVNEINAPKKCLTRTYLVRMIRARLQPFQATKPDACAQGFGAPWPAPVRISLPDGVHQASPRTQQHSPAPPSLVPKWQARRTMPPPTQGNHRSAQPKASQGHYITTFGNANLTPARNPNDFEKFSERARTLTYSFARMDSRPHTPSAIANATWPATCRGGSPPSIRLSRKAHYVKSGCAAPIQADQRVTCLVWPDRAAMLS